MPQPKLEICAFNIQSCIVAQKAGAQRVELCDNPSDGGTTPSYGAILQTREAVQIELFPIIRPRGGHCWYDEDEFAMMLHDIRMCKSLQCDGISIGVQLQSGEIDADRMRRIVDLAYPMEVTCNRAFDAVPNPREALEAVIDTGCTRILTSGLKSSAPEGAGMLQQLVQWADERISIMPGAGVRSNNIATLREHTGAYEFHTSARKISPSLIQFSNPNILDIGTVYIADEEEVRNCVHVLQSSVIS